MTQDERDTLCLCVLRLRDFLHQHPQHVYKALSDLDSAIQRYPVIEGGKPLGTSAGLLMDVEQSHRHLLKLE